MPARAAAAMMLSPGSKGIVFPSYVKVGIRWSLRSMIALAADHVQRAKARHDVAQHPARDELRQAAGDLEARRPDAHPVRRAAAVGDEVVTELAVAALRSEERRVGKECRSR